MWTFHVVFEKEETSLSFFGLSFFAVFEQGASSQICASVESDVEDSVLKLHFALIHNESCEISSKDKFVCFRMADGQSQTLQQSPTPRATILGAFLRLQLSMHGCFPWRFPLFACVFECFP